MLPAALVASVTVPMVVIAIVDLFWCLRNARNLSLRLPLVSVCPDLVVFMKLIGTLTTLVG